MAYRGDDLDLRVPQGWGTGQRGGAPYDVEANALNGRWSRGPASLGRSEPLWVDETVMACCNHAYDLALAHGASEVRLEHLVHALTRVDAASQILEQRGVREGQLRRESAALIANDHPLGTAGERGQPRRAPELEEVLRRASALAQRRGAVASIDDLLYVLLTSQRESEAIALLRRNTPDWQRAEWSKAREPRYVMPEPPHRMEVPRMEPLMLPEPVTSRLEIIESALRGIHAELAGDRKLLSDVVRDLQREVAAQRGDNVVLGNSLAERLQIFEQQLIARTQASHLVDRLQALERNLHEAVAESSKEFAPLSERLTALEQAVHGGMAEGARNWAALLPKLGGIDELKAHHAATPSAIERLDGRLAALEPLIEQRLIDASQGATTIADRVGALERLIESRFTDTVRGWTAMADRMQALERIAQSGIGDNGRAVAQLGEDLGRMGEALRLQADAEATDRAQLAERMALIERSVRSGLGDTVRSSALIADRLGIVEKIMGSRDDGEAALLIDERLRALEATFAGRAQETGSRWQQLVDQLGKIEQRIVTGETRGAPALAPETMLRPILPALEALDKSVAAGSGEQIRALGEVAGRIAAIEHVIAANSAAIDEAARMRTRDLEEVHEALIRLNENQHAIARSLNDWRLEAKGDASIIANRLEDLPVVKAMIEAAVAAAQEHVATTGQRAASPAATATAAGATVAAPVAQRVEVVEAEAPHGRGDEAEAAAPRTETYAARHRGFWWWLFGTHNVRQANRDAELRWQRMHASIKTVRERLRERR